MKATVLAMTLLATAFAQADDKSDGSAVEPTKVETAHAEMEVAQAEMDAARAEMEAARQELQAAAKRMAKASRKHLVSAKDRAFLGVLIRDQSEDGIVIAGVTPAGGAEAAGLESDDIIVAINGESLTGRTQPVDILHEVLADVSPGAEVKLTVLRDGDVGTYDVHTTPKVIRIEGDASGLLRSLGQALQGHITPAAPLAPPLAPTRPWLNLLRTPGATGQLHLVDIGEDLGGYFGVDGGVLVLNVPGKSELKPGDVVRRIDGADVGSADEAYHLLATTSGDDAEVEVRRKNRKTEVTVPKGSPWVAHEIRAMPRGKAKIIVNGPEVEVDVEVEKDD